MFDQDKVYLQKSVGETWRRTSESRRLQKVADWEEGEYT